KWAVRNRVYTNKTHLRGFENLDFSLVRVGGLCLCSHEFYSLGLKFTPMGNAMSCSMLCIINGL
ncbi:MAG TPA: hypothetical protein VK203_26265, partial [Nostocaceae cyanobacterium]|nr:hypothetical protein [Nostocaceae cyanobacterium]